MSSKSRLLFIAGCSGAIVVVTSIVFRGHFQSKIRERDEELLRQADQIARLEAENERLSNFVARTANTEPLASGPSDELLRLRGEVGVLHEQSKELDILRNENAGLSQAVAEFEAVRVSAGQASAPTNAPESASFKKESLDFLQAQYQLDEANIQQQLTNLVQLRERYATNDKPYLDLQHSIDVMISFHQLLASHIEAVRLDQEVNTQPSSP